MVIFFCVLTDFLSGGNFVCFRGDRGRFGKLSLYPDIPRVGTDDKHRKNTLHKKVRTASRGCSLNPMKE